MAGKLVRTLPVSRLFCCLALLFFSHAGWPQEAVRQDTSMRELIETQQAVEKLTEEQQDTDRGGIAPESTPLSSLLAVREALRERDYTRAGDFLDMRYLPEELSEHTPEQLVQATDEEMARVEAMLQEWRERNRQPFPDFTPEEIQAFRGSIEFP